MYSCRNDSPSSIECSQVPYDDSSQSWTLEQPYMSSISEYTEHEYTDSDCEAESWDAKVYSVGIKYLF